MKAAESSQKIIIICGPTASGKTAAAMELARKIGAEVVGADSGQVYRGMDIGTAKPSHGDRQKVCFHLVDILNPDEQFSAADFLRLATEVIDEIRSRGKRVVVAGGTGLYLKVLEEGLFEGPSRDAAIRGELERRVREEGVESLHRELEKVDPEAAKSIPSRNRQRLIRALEVYRLTGRPISSFWREHQSGGRYHFVKFGLTLPKDELYRRIDERVDRMVEGGWVEEVRGLVGKWGREAPGLRLIGYKELVSHLRGEFSLDEAISLIKKNTRQYAKRQMTWFRKDTEIQWVRDLREVSVS